MKSVGLDKRTLVREAARERGKAPFSPKTKVFQDCGRERSFAALSLVSHLGKVPRGHLNLLRTLREAGQGRRRLLLTCGENGNREKKGKEKVTLEISTHWIQSGIGDMTIERKGMERPREKGV